MLFSKSSGWLLCAIMLCWMITVQARKSDSLPSLYEYYAPKNVPIKSGLSADGDQFRLNDKPFVIFSGSFHYFRVVPERWRLTLQKFKAAGLNSVQLYIPWNRHEPQPGHFDFESYGLNLTQFLMDIREADMFAILRPGPYICAEWELGGLPPWLLKDPKMDLRTEYPGFMEPAKRYYSKVLDIVDRFQFSKHGGPIIAMQFENEYYGDWSINHSLSYLNEYHKLIRSKKFSELLFTSDPVGASINAPVQPGVLETSNLNNNAKQELSKFHAKHLKQPIYVSEFWPGWFDSWGEHTHHLYSVAQYEQQLTEILFQVNGSVNFYMFIGGTNFGYYNGARVVTSYDYDAPLSESGNYTDKYRKTKGFYEKLVASGRHPKILIPSEPPKINLARNYGTSPVHYYLSFENLLKLMKPIQSKQALFMEFIDGTSGFGFIMYRFQSKPFQTLNITGYVKDRLVVMVNGVIVGHTDDYEKSYNQKMNPAWFPDPKATYTIDLLVENLGRNNFGKSDMNQQRKGINSPILLDQKEQKQFQIFTFDLNEDFMKQANNSDQWKVLKPDANNTGPLLLRTYLVIEEEIPFDTFLLLPDWTHGNVFVNNFNIGRYNRAGPQKTLYIPGPLLKQGANTIHVFETGTIGKDLQFIDHPILQ